MRLECPSCGKVYDIPDERIPKDKGIAFPCPACGGTIHIDPGQGPAMPDGRAAHPAKERRDRPESSQRGLPMGTALKERILKSVRDLPAMPQSIFKAREIISNPNSSFSDIAGVLERDQALATRVLKLANSAYYGFVGKVSSLQQASVVLGLKTLEELIAMAGTSGIMGKELRGYQLDAGDLWQHSLCVALGAKVIAKRKDPSIENDAFTAGLVHDVGKLALDPYLLERKEAFDGFVARGNESFLGAEKEILGIDHGEIASELCNQWNVPRTLTVAIRYHHTPSSSRGSELAHMVHIADVIAMMSGMGAGIDGMLYHMDEGALAFLGLQEDEINDIMVEAVGGVQEIMEGSSEGLGRSAKN